jgi:hypothetical protein
MHTSWTSTTGDCPVCRLPAGEAQRDEGPLGTTDYRIVLEATPAEEGKTFIRLAYSYSYGLLGQLAMQTYLVPWAAAEWASRRSTPAPRPPRSVGGMREAGRRNTMRYYLAIESYLGALSAAPRAQVEKSLRALVRGDRKRIRGSCMKWSRANT